MPEKATRQAPKKNRDPSGPRLLRQGTRSPFWAPSYPPNDEMGLQAVTGNGVGRRYGAKLAGEEPV
jgi:hypothetical protein